MDARRHAAGAAHVWIDAEQGQDLLTVPTNIARS
jgi:hypothetical protein